MRDARIKIGQFTLAPFRELIAAGEILPIRHKQLDILSVLAVANGSVVTKGELMHAAWHGAIVEENAVQVHISALRKILGRDADRLVTVRGLGYRLVSDADEESDAAALPRYASVAVLRFVNMTGDDRLAHLGEGLAEELTNTLSRRKDLIVSSRTSSFTYTDQTVDARTIGSELGVGTIVEGSVRLADQTMRVTAQLIDTENGFHIWSQNFDHPLSDSLTMQDDLASVIAKELRKQLHSHVEVNADSD